MFGRLFGKAVLHKGEHMAFSSPEICTRTFLFACSQYHSFSLLLPSIPTKQLCLSQHPFQSTSLTGRKSDLFFLNLKFRNLRG